MKKQRDKINTSFYMFAVCFVLSVFFVGTVSAKPSQFKPELLGVCDEKTGNLYDDEGKVVEKMMFHKITNNTGKGKVFRAFVFKLPNTTENMHFIPPRKLPISKDRSYNTFFMAAPMFLDSYAGHQRLIVQGAIPGTYRRSVFGGFSSRDVAVDEVDFKLRYYYGPRNKADFTISGPFELDKTYNSADGSGYTVKMTEEKGWTGCRSKLYVKITGPLSLKEDTPIVFYDKSGKRHVQGGMPHDRRKFSVLGKKSKLKFELVNLKVSTIASIAAEIPHEIEFKNVKTQFNRKSSRDYVDDQKIITELMVKDIKKISKENRKRLLDIAGEWIKSDSTYQKYTAAGIGLFYKQPEFADPALDILSGDYKGRFGYSIDDGRYSTAIDLDTTTYQSKLLMASGLKKFTNLNPQQLEKLKKAILQANTHYLLQEIFECLGANKTPAALKVWKELAANDRPAIWVWAANMWHFRDPNKLKPQSQWPIETRKRLHLGADGYSDKEIASEALAMILGILDADFLFMQPGKYQTFRRWMIASLGRKTAAQADIKLLKELSDEEVVYRFRDRYNHSYFDGLVRTVTGITTNLNSWYGVNLGGLGEEIPWMGDYKGKAPRNADELKSLIDEVLGWYSANPNAELAELAITGKVLDKSGNAVANAELEFICSEKTSVQGRRNLKAGTVKTDKDGSFVFKNPKSGHNYYVNVSAVGFKSREVLDRIHVSWTNSGAYRVEDRMNPKMGEDRTNDIILVKDVN